MTPNVSLFLYRLMLIIIYDIRKTDFSSRASIVWQDCVDKGEPAPTWDYSDAARKAGAQGMLYASRSRPDLTHLVLFDVSTAIIKETGDGKAWHECPVHQCSRAILIEG